MTEEQPRTTGALPIAPHLRPTPGDPGEWVWTYTRCATDFGVDLVAPEQARRLPIKGEA